MTDVRRRAGAAWLDGRMARPSGARHAERDWSAVLFDLDGTLLDHAGAVHAAVLHLLDRHRATLEVTVDEAVACWRAAEGRWFTRYLAGGLSFTEQRRRRIGELWALAGATPPSDAAADVAFACYLSAYEHSWRLYPDVVDALDRLADLRLGVVTNGDADQQRGKLQRLGLLDRFDAVIVSSEVGVAKPDPAIFRLAADAVQTPPGSCIYVGDQPDSDAEAATGAGLYGVWLERAPSGTGPRHATTPTVGSLAALVDRYGLAGAPKG
jgi:putative hydrolase of the HAD superfamily